VVNNNNSNGYTGIASNCAVHLISTTSYDKRALVVSDPLPLSISLLNLHYLTRVSPLSLGYYLIENDGTDSLSLLVGLLRSNLKHVVFFHHNSLENEMILSSENENSGSSTFSSHSSNACSDDSVNMRFKRRGKGFNRQDSCKRPTPSRAFLANTSPSFERVSRDMYDFYSTLLEKIHVQQLSFSRATHQTRSSEQATSKPNLPRVDSHENQVKETDSNASSKDSLTNVGNSNVDSSNSSVESDARYTSVNQTPSESSSMHDTVEDSKEKIHDSLESSTTLTNNSNTAGSTNPISSENNTNDNSNINNNNIISSTASVSSGYDDSDSEDSWCEENSAQGRFLFSNAMTCLANLATAPAVASDVETPSVALYNASRIRIKEALIQTGIIPVIHLYLKDVVDILTLIKALSHSQWSASTVVDSAAHESSNPTNTSSDIPIAIPTQGLQSENIVAEVQSETSDLISSNSPNSNRVNDGINNNNGGNLVTDGVLLEDSSSHSQSFNTINSMQFHETATSLTQQSEEQESLRYSESPPQHSESPPQHSESPPQHSLILENNSSTQTTASLTQDQISSSPSQLSPLPLFSHLLQISGDLLVVLKLLQTLAKYPHIRPHLHQTHPKPTPAFSPATYSTGPGLIHLIETLTASHHVSSEVRSTAVSLMRHAYRRDHDLGVRMCAYTGCRVWEQSAKVFSKCSRCRRVTYCR
jgi:hypothetical protein